MITSDMGAVPASSRSHNVNCMQLLLGVELNRCVDCAIALVISGAAVVTYVAPVEEQRAAMCLVMVVPRLSVAILRQYAHGGHCMPTHASGGKELSHTLTNALWWSEHHMRCNDVSCGSRCSAENARPVSCRQHLQRSGRSMMYFHIWFLKIRSLWLRVRTGLAQGWCQPFSLSPCPLATVQQAAIRPGANVSRAMQPVLRQRAKCAERRGTVLSEA